MFVIFGIVPRIKVLKHGEFYCPRDGQTRHYELKHLSQWFMLFFIPVFKWRDEGKFVECTYCNTRYSADVLT